MANLTALPALDVRPPADPIEGYAKVLSVQGMLQNQKLAATQQQMANVQLTQAQKAQQDQEALGQLMIKHKGNLDKVIADAPGAGVQPNTVIGLQQHVLDVKTKTMDLVQKQGAEAARQADLMAGAHDAVSKASDDQRPAAYKNQLQALQKQGVDTSTMPQEYPGDDQFQMIGAVVQGHKQMVEDALKQSEVGKNAAQAGEATSRGKEADAQTKKIGMETDPNNPADPNIAKAKYERILQAVQTKGIMAVPPADVQWAQAHEYEQKKNSTVSDSLGVTSNTTSGPAGLAAATAAGRRSGNQALPGTPAMPAGGGASPSASPVLSGTPNMPAQSSSAMATPMTASKAKEGIVDMIGNYKLGFGELSRALAKHPELPALVNEKYPDWSQGEYNARNALIKKMTSGDDAKQLDSINTAMGHLKNFDDAIGALHNGNMTLLNKIGNSYNINVAGKTAEAAAKLIADKIGSELASAYIPGGGGEKERIANRGDFDISLPEQTLHNNAATAVDLLRSKISSMENRYKTTLQRDNFADRFLTPQAKAALQQFAKPAQGGGQSGNSSPASGANPGEKAVIHNGVIVGYTSDGKTMRPVSNQ